MCRVSLTIARAVIVYLSAGGSYEGLGWGRKGYGGRGGKGFGVGHREKLADRCKNLRENWNRMRISKDSAAA